MRARTILSAAIAVAALGACSGGPGEPTTATVAESTTSVRKVPQSADPYTLFETLQVRPLAMSADGSLLFATNTPDNRLEVFGVERRGLRPVGSVVVGLEPIAVAAACQRGRLGGQPPVGLGEHRRRRTASGICGVVAHALRRRRAARHRLRRPEPRAARSSPPRTAARTRPTIPISSTRRRPRRRLGVRRDNLGTAPGGTRLTKLTLFADTPRALAASADGKTVYAAAFFSGDQTTVASEDAVDGLRRRHARTRGHRPRRRRSSRSRRRGSS
jgi:hypothetical protein